MALTFVKLARPSPSSALGMEDNPMLLDQQEGMGKDLVVNPPQQTNDLHQSLLSRSPSKQQMERYLDGLYQNINYLKEKLDNLPDKSASGTASRGISSIDTARNSNTGVVTLTFNFDDNTSETDDFVVNDGRDGVGLRGLRGLAGTSVTITSSSTNADGNIVVNFSDGSSIIVPSGTDGDDGDDGADGATWLTGVGVPANNLGVNGDFYLRTFNTTIYSKSGGAWSVLSSLAGADGATWHTGIIEPVSALGNNGDFYFKSDDASIWSKASGAWTQQIEIQQGTDGEDGDDGADGTVWHSGAGVPANDVGAQGDFYFQTSNGYVYEKTGAIVWSFRRDVTGPQGLRGLAGARGTSVTITSSSTNADGNIVVNFSDGSSIIVPSGTDGDDGDDGADGATWLTGVGVPANNLGVNGDFYLRTFNTTIYSKSGGAWSVLSSLAGADGATWHTGIIEPVSALGNNGDFYFKSDDASIWSKASGAWTQQIEIQQGTDGEDGDDGADGTVWHSGAGVPANDVGAQGDFYFQTSNGYVYEKTGAIVWSFRRDVTGPQGLRGLAGARGTSVTITSSSTNADGNIVVNFSDGSSIIVPSGTDGDDGDDGADGATWLTGVGVPANNLGVNGDFYLRTFNTTIYSKSGGAWSVLSSLAGADGATWHTGIIEPVSALGNNGDFYFKSDDASIWSKASGAWTQQIEIQQGTDGEDGDDGADGTVWLNGYSPPRSNQGKVGDFYFRFANGFVYRKVASNAWSFQRDLTGPQGLRGLAGTSVTVQSVIANADGDIVLTFSDGAIATIPKGTVGRGIKAITRDADTNTVTITFDDGSSAQEFTLADGVDGKTWFSGSGEPAAALGNNGDFYLRTSNKNVYKKVNGRWGVEANLSGTDGATWFNGSTAPLDASGVNGDFYFRTSNATIWSKVAGAWTQLINITGSVGLAGSTWLSGNGAPANALGEIGDWYFRTSNGYVYEKTAETVWTFRRDVTGPQGLKGNKGDQGLKGIAGIPGEDATSVKWFPFTYGLPYDTRKTATPATSGGGHYQAIYPIIVWHSGAGAPDSMLGNNDDKYFRTSDTFVWHKNDLGVWNAQTQLSTLYIGGSFHAGTGLPANDLGIQGDWYLNLSDGKIYKKIESARWTFSADIDGDEPAFSWDTVTELKFSTRDDDGVDRRDIFTAESLQFHPKLIGIRRDAPNNDVHVVAFKTTSEWTLDTANSVVSVDVERVSGSDKGTVAEIAPIADADYDVHLVLPLVVDNISLYGVRYPGNFDSEVDSVTATAMAALADPTNDAWPATAIVYANEVTPGDNVNGDKVTLYRGSVSQTRVWSIATETWAGFEGYIGGNLLVDGAIVANHLAANAVTAVNIKADAIEARHIKVGEVIVKDQLMIEDSVILFRHLSPLLIGDFTDIHELSLASALSPVDSNTSALVWNYPNITGRLYVDGDSDSENIQDVVVTRNSLDEVISLRFEPERITFNRPYRRIRIQRGRSTTSTEDTPSQTYRIRRSIYNFLAFSFTVTFTLKLGATTYEDATAVASSAPISYNYDQVIRDRANSAEFPSYPSYPSYSPTISTSIGDDVFSALDIALSHTPIGGQRRVFVDARIEFGPEISSTTNFGTNLNSPGRYTSDGPFYGTGHFSVRTIEGTLQTEETKPFA